MNTEFTSLMDRVCTCLLEGELWHQRSANLMRMAALRGFGRWHDSEGYCDAETRVCLEKLACDRLGHEIELDINVAAPAVSYSIGGSADLPRHLQQWVAREEKFIPVLNDAVRMAAGTDVCLYKDLICLAEEVQAEAMRVKIVEKRLALAQWGGHDIGIVSMILHEHFEEHPHDKYINVNLG